MRHDGIAEKCWIHFTERTKHELKLLAEQLKLHPLATQSLLSESHLPKIDVYDDSLFISLAWIQEEWRVSRLQLIITKQYVISYTKNNEPMIEQVEKKLLHHPEEAVDPCFVFYRMLDVATFHFLHVIDEIANKIQALEKQVFKTPFENEIGHSVYRWKVKIHELRQTIEAQEEMMKTLNHPEIPHINEKIRPYLQDVSSRFSRSTAALDAFKETLSDIFNLQLSLKSDHMNTIMKTLTLVSVIFMPMTFVAGVYGMNFKWMPELTWTYGYIYALGLMGGLGIAIAFYFKKKGWWGKKKDGSI
ncbi:magnesium and cobalt transport protein CorA [Anoxybacillus sp. UARK-01]|uniref:magnesium/cobalt transporter CorA n=1 Tax=Anoxybacillaceae TaxID=3120669 RepID=UPI0009BB3BC1|nr:MULTISPECIES: magnesium/cobalt transporter CorA [Anoxybacillus]MBB3908008.1 magnesium transporter [Anoxybacillus rupiensis]OQM46056.1 magnesium and cobalt transport protein CorA [Anoxybacillus sp. UARK-01]